MKKFEAKKQIKSRFYSKATVIGLLFLIILLAKGVVNIYLRESESSTMRAEAELKMNDLQKRKDVVSNEINRLNSNEGMEEEIRTKFNVTKPGEKVVLIVDDNEATTTVENPGFFAGLWRKIWK